MVAGALGGLVLGYREYVNKPVIDKRVLDQVQGGHNCLTITQGYYPKPKPVATTSVMPQYIFFQEDQYQVMSNVSFKPGPDGNLYLKINGEWKQVLTS